MYWKLIAKILSKYGAWAANSASIHGTYEPKVPESLQKKCTKQRISEK